MKPTQGQVRPVANPLYSRMLVEYMNADDGFVARMAAPVLSDGIDESGTYALVDKTLSFQDDLTRRAYGDKFAQGGFEYGSDTYITQQWGLEIPIPVEREAASQIPGTLLQQALKRLAHASNIRKERAFAADFMTTSVWTTDSTPTDWDDASGVPITDILTGKRTIRQLGVGEANALIMGEIVYHGLLVNAQVVGKLQYTETLTMETVKRMLAAVLGVEMLGVSTAIYNSANAGATDSLSPIIDDDALLVVVDPAPDMFSVSGLKTFAWGGGGGQGEALTYYSNERKSTIAQHTEQWDQKLISANAGNFFSDIV